MNILMFKFIYKYFGFLKCYYLEVFMCLDKFGRYYSILDILRVL